MAVSRRIALGEIGSVALLLPTSAKGALAPTQPLTMGPFYPLTKPSDHDIDLTQVSGRSKRAIGTVIEVSGQVTDIRGHAIPHARIELWQANAAGRYFHPSDSNPAPLDPNFQGYASFVTDNAGHYRFLTVKPGAYPGGRGTRTPHIHFEIDGRVNRLVTQMFFPGESLNAQDLIFRDVEDPRLSTAVKLGDGPLGVVRFQWNIVLRTG